LLGEVIEPIDIDVCVGTEPQCLGPGFHSRRAERLTRVVRRLVQARRGGVERYPGPQRLDDLLAMQAAPGREREKLHERCRVSPGPRG
jgi:hypothetical protein